MWLILLVPWVGKRKTGWLEGMGMMKICWEGRYKVKVKTSIFPVLRQCYSSWLRGTNCPGGSTHHLELTKGIKDGDGWLLARRLSSVYLCRTSCFLGLTRLIPGPKSKRTLESWDVRSEELYVTALIRRGPDISHDFPGSHTGRVAMLGTRVS